MSDAKTYTDQRGGPLNLVGRSHRLESQVFPLLDCGLDAEYAPGLGVDVPQHPEEVFVFLFKAVVFRL